MQCNTLMPNKLIWVRTVLVYTTQVTYNQDNCMFTYMPSTDSDTRINSNSYLSVHSWMHALQHSVLLVHLSYRAEQQGEARAKTNYITTAAMDSFVSLGSWCTLPNIGSVFPMGVALPDTSTCWVKQSVVVIKSRAEELKFISWLN